MHLNDKLLHILAT